MKKSEETSKKIIDTVIEMLKTNESITIKDICKKAYINIAAVNYHFGDKDTLITLAVQQIINELKEKVVLMAEQNFESTEDAIYQFVDLIYDFATEYSGALKYMLYSEPDSPGGKSLQPLFWDKKFIDFVFEKISSLTGVRNKAELMSKYMIIVSSFMFPLLCQYAFPPDSEYSMTNEDFKKQYLAQMVKILTT